MERTLRALLTLSALAAAFSQCSMPVDNVQTITPAYADRDTILVDRVFMNIPSCLAPTVAKRAMSAGAEDTLAFGMYGHVRQYIDLANSMVFYAKKNVTNYYNNVVKDTVFQTGTTKAKIRLDSNATHRNQLTVWISDVRAMELQFSKVGTNDFTGYCIVRVDAFDANMPANETVRVDFNTADASGRLMTVALTDAYLDPATDGTPQKILLQVQEQGNSLVLKGGAYSPSTNSHTNAQGWCYLFRAKINATQNMAALDMGVPPATATDSASSYGTHGPEAIVVNWLYEKMDTTIRADTTGTQAALAFASVKYGKKVPLDNVVRYAVLTADTATYLTYEQVSPYLSIATADSITSQHIVSFLELNQAHASWAPWYGYLYEGKQPVYFSGNSGYAANGATPPAGFAFTATATHSLGTYLPADIVSANAAFADPSGPGF